MEEIFEVEKLNCIRNEMTHLWGSIFATSGGVIALVLSEFSVLKLFFIIFGTLLSLVMINAYFIRRTEVMNILKGLKQTSKKNIRRYRMDIHVFTEWFVVLAYIGMGIFAVYKYTKQNHDYKW